MEAVSRHRLLEAVVEKYICGTELQRVGNGERIVQSIPCAAVERLRGLLAECKELAYSKRQEYYYGKDPQKEFCMYCHMERGKPHIPECEVELAERLIVDIERALEKGELGKL